MVQFLGHINCHDRLTGYGPMAQPYFATLHHPLQYSTMSSHAVPYPAMSSHTQPHSATLYHTLPYSAILYRILPYSTILCHTLPYSTIFSHMDSTILYHTLPYSPTFSHICHILQSCNNTAITLALPLNISDANNFMLIKVRNTWHQSVRIFSCEILFLV